jgi:Ca-activated chloride channel homolog
MSFSWPLALLTLLSVPILLGIYVWQLRKKRKSAVVFSNLALIKAAMPARASWKRHIPVALFLLGLTGLGVATARPQATVKVPLGRTSIILALDVSRSMCSTDVDPNRLSVAQEAARSFVKAQPKGTRLGLVVFAGFAQLTVPPTSERQPLVDAINNLTTARGTAIGAAIFKSLDAIATVNPEVPPIGADLSSKAELGSAFDPYDPPAFNDEITEPPTAKAPVPQQGYIPDIVVLLTDGANTRGIDPLIAAKQAAQRRVRVYTIGFGTEEPTEMVCTAAQVGSDGFDDRSGGGGIGGRAGGIGGGSQDPNAQRSILKIDEPTLRGVSNMTGGEFFKASDADQLRKVFDNLPKQVTLQDRKTEIGFAFVLASALLAIAAMVLSMRWNR